jgi:hypothetical protein
MDLFFGLLLSAHIGLENEYNSIHPHLGAYLNNDRTISVGTYFNSESKMSTYAAYTYDFGPQFFAQIGAVTGYTGSKVKPMVKLNYKNYFIAPSVETFITRDGIIDRQNVGLVVGLEWRQ